MKTMIKAVWLIATLVALGACKKHKHTEVVTPPEQNKMVFFSDVTGSTYAVNALTGTGMWKYDFNGGSSYNTAAAVTKNAVVYTDYETGTVMCYNINTGSLIWSKTVQVSWSASPLIINDVVYVAVSGGIIGYALNDGAEVKSISIPGNLTPNSLNYYQNRFIIGTCGGHLVGINTDGVVLWEYLSGYGCYHNNPVIVNDVLYIISSGGKLSAVDPVNGLERWSRNIGEYSQNVTPVYNNGLLFVQGYADQNHYYAIDITNGDVSRRFTLPDGQTNGYGYNTPAVMADVMYAVTAEGRLLAYNINTQQLVWQNQLGTAGARSVPTGVMLDGRLQDMDAISSIVIANNVLYFAYGKSMFATSLNGEKKWEMFAGNYILSSPVIMSSYEKVYRPANAGVVQ